MAIQKVKKVCKQCGKIFDFYPFPSAIKYKRGQFCSRSCVCSFTMKGNKINLGKKHSKKTRKKMKKSHININHWNWKDGRKKTREGYILIYQPNHPSCNYDKGIKYVREHRLIMEKKLGRYLTRQEVVHHINGIRDDNRIENLKLLTRSSHTSYHQKEKNKNRIFKYRGKEKEYKKEWLEKNPNYNAEYYQKNKVKILEQCKERYLRLLLDRRKRSNSEITIDNSWFDNCNL